MIVIENINALKFRLNGIPYYKNFTGVVRQDKVKIVNVYDSKLCLSELKDYTQYSVDGVVHVNVANLQDALLPVLFTRASLGSGFGGLVTIGKMVFDYTIPSIVIPAGAQVIDIQNMNNNGEVIGFTVVDATHITIDNGCETDDKIKLIYIY